MSKYPISGVVYTLRDLLQLNLRDSPSLQIHWQGKVGDIQDAHVTEEQLLSVPGLAETQWRFIRTTHEWIPIFHAVEVEDVLKCVDIEPYIDKYELLRNPGWWITPKGFPRSQEE